jgi:vacuolar protein sorting-associated protein 35
LQTQDLPEEGEGSGSVSLKKVFQFLHQMVEALAMVPAAELSLRLYLQCAEAAGDCGLEPVAYEFFTQAFVLYEEEVSVSQEADPSHCDWCAPAVKTWHSMLIDIAVWGLQDSKAQVTALQLIIGTLQRTGVFGVENRDTLTHKATGVSWGFCTGVHGVGAWFLFIWVANAF